MRRSGDPARAAARRRPSPHFLRFDEQGRFSGVVLMNPRDQLEPRRRRLREPARGRPGAGAGTRGVRARRRPLGSAVGPLDAVAAGRGQGSLGARRGRQLAHRPPSPGGPPTSRFAGPRRLSGWMIAMARHRPRFRSSSTSTSQPVRAFLRGMVGPNDAEDCLQETFLAALRAYPRAEATNLRAWVLTIARRKAIDHHRARDAPGPAGGRARRARRRGGVPGRPAAPGLG